MGKGARDLEKWSIGESFKFIEICVKTLAGICWGDDMAPILSICHLNEALAIPNLFTPFVQNGLCFINTVYASHKTDHWLYSHLCQLNSSDTHATGDACPAFVSENHTP
jgi:hypothetical protein